MIDLDNSATTRPFDTVIDAMSAGMRGAYHNPSSLYAPALAAERSIAALSRRLCKLTGGQDAILTSGGTEANNLAVLGTLGAVRGPRTLVVSAIEHPSVMETARAAAKAHGAQLVVLPVGPSGVLDLDALDAALDARPALLSVMQVNNEIGSLQPIQEIGRRLRARSPGTVFHVDGVQGFLRVPLSMPDAGADLYTVSAHKLHGPKGIGALIRRGGVRLAPILHGGGQQAGLRSGTENMPGIVGFLAALDVWGEMAGEGARAADGTPGSRAIDATQLPPAAFPAAWAAHCRAMKLRVAEILTAAGALVNGPRPEDAAPHILNVAFPGVRGEVLLHALEARGILVSTGSACSSHRRKPSPVLTAIGASRDRIEAAIRLSFGALNRPEETEAAAREIVDAAKELSAFVRR